MSSSSQENFPLLIQRQFVYYFGTTELSLPPRLDTIIMYHLFFVWKKKENKKHKLVTLQKSKESKKRVNYSIHHFWKQDLSANNYLPSFSDDLNAHKNPNVSNFNWSSR